MDQLHLMTVFVAVAEEQGFAAGARRLNMSPPAVTRAVATLEERLGVKLLNRTTRYVRATDAGLRYLEDSRRIINDVQLANEGAAGVNSEPQGAIAVTAPVLFGQMFVMPSIVTYLKSYPKTQVDAVFLDRVVNLLEEGLDVGVRIGELPDSSMRAIRVGAVSRVLVATPDYLHRYGRPEHPDDLQQHNLIMSRAGNGSSVWPFRDGTKAVKFTPRLSTTTNDAAVSAALQGFGITRLLSYQVSEQLNAGTLQRLLPDFEPDPIPIHIVHREGRLASVKVRAFIDHMAAALKANDALNRQ